MPGTNRYFHLNFRVDTNIDLARTPALPLTLYGPELSYFTGKLEAVIRYMELPYRRLGAGPMGPEALAAGVAQVPAMQLADDRWQTDTTPIINWLDERYQETAVIPRDPVTAFFSRLLEDYADEWLWRPAMHYRWDYAEGAPYRNLRTAPYRVWCLEQLRNNFNALSQRHQTEVRARLEAHGCWEPLWRVQDTNSGIDPDHKVPFAGGSSATGVPAKVAPQLHWLPVAAAKQK